MRYEDPWTILAAMRERQRRMYRRLTLELEATACRTRNRLRPELDVTICPECGRSRAGRVDPDLTRTQARRAAGLCVCGEEGSE